MAQKKQEHSHIGLGVGIVAAVAAAAGVYFMYGTKAGAKKRAKIRGWTFKMKGEILDRLEKVKELNEGTYHNIVDSVAKGYSTLQGVDQKELALLVMTLKKYWKNIQKDFGAKKKTTKRSTK